MNPSQCQKIDGWKADDFSSSKLQTKQRIKCTRHAYGYIIVNTFSSSSEEGSVARFGNAAAEYLSMKETFSFSSYVPTLEKARRSIRVAFKGHVSA